MAKTNRYLTSANARDKYITARKKQEEKAQAAKIIADSAKQDDINKQNADKQKANEWNVGNFLGGLANEGKDIVGTAAKGLTKFGADVFNDVTTLGNEKEAAKRTSEFMKSTGAENWDKGESITGDIAGGVLGGIPSELYDTAKKTGRDIVTTIGAGAATNKATSDTSMASVYSKERQDKLSKLVDMNNPDDPRWNSKEVKDLNAKYDKKIKGLTKSASEASQSQSVKDFQNLKPQEVAGAAAENVINAASLGTAGFLKKASEGIAKEGSVLASEKLIPKIVASGVLGGGQSAATAAKEDRAITPQDVAMGVAMNVLPDAVGEIAGKLKGKKVEPRKPEDVQSEISKIDNGEVPEEMLSKPTPVQSADEIALHDNLPEPIKQSGQVIAYDKLAAQKQLDNLMTETKAFESKNDLDAEYKQKLDALSDMPDIRYAREKAKIDQDYESKLDEIDQQLDNDFDKVEQLTKAQEAIKLEEIKLLGDVNEFQSTYEKDLTRPNQELVDARKQELQSELDESTKYHSPEGVVERASEGGNLAKNIENPEVATAAKEHVNNLLENYKDRELVDSVDILMSPSKRFDSIGLRDLHTKAVNAFGKTSENISQDKKVIAEIANELKNNKSVGKDIIDYIAGKTDKIRASDEGIANTIKSFLDEKRAIMESMGYKGIDNYFPQFFDKEDKVVMRLFGDKTTGDINFGNFKHRTKNSEDYSKDIVDVLTRYSVGFNKKVHFEPALKDLQAIAESGKLKADDAKYTLDYLKQVSRNSTSKLGESVNQLIDAAENKFDIGKPGSNHYNKALSAQRQLSAVASLGGNIASGIRQLTTLNNVVRQIGTKNTLIGLKDTLKTLPDFVKGRGEISNKEFRESGAFDGGMGADFNLDINDMAMNGRGVIENGKDALMAMTKLGDYITRGSAYKGSKAKFLSDNAKLPEGKRLSGEKLESAARKYATENTIDSNFVTNKMDMPLILNSQEARSLAQFATFSAKQAEFLKASGIKVLPKKNESGKWTIDKGEAAKLLESAATTALTVAVLAPTMGYDPKELIPFYDQIATGQLYQSPLVTMLLGNTKGKTGLVQGIQGHISGNEKDKNLEDFWNSQWSQFIPGGAQIKKTVEGHNTTETGESKSGAGNIKFLQGTTDPDKLQALLFGQYATKAGKEWVNNGMTTMTKSQTERLQELPQGAKEKYYDFYVSKSKLLGSDKALEEIKSAAKTDLNRARRLTKEFNSKVDDVVVDYYKKQPNLPTELKDEVENSMKIDIQDVIDNLNKKPSAKSVLKQQQYDLENME